MDDGSSFLDTTHESDEETSANTSVRSPSASADLPPDDDSFLDKVLLEGMTPEGKARVRAVYVDEIVARVAHYDPDQEGKADAVRRARSRAHEEARRIRVHQELRRMVRANEPALTVLRIEPVGDVAHFPTRDWKAFGKQIGENTHLKELHVGRLGVTGKDAERYVTRDDVREFLRGVASNRSIEQLGFADFHLFSPGAFRTLGDFFGNNPVLRYLSVRDCTLRNLHPDLASALRRFDALREFELSHKRGGVPWRTGTTDRKAAEVVRALAGHTRLRKLFLSGNRIGTGGTTALALTGLLQGPHCRLVELDLSDNPIDDPGHNANKASHGAKFLSSALLGCATLARLNLSGTDVSARGWAAVATALGGPHCRLEHLDLSSNAFDDGAFGPLATVLAGKRTLRSLALRGCDGMRRADVLDIARLLEDPDAALERLDLADNDGVDDGAAISLAKAMRNNKKLRTLILNDNNIGDKAWAAFSRTLCDRASYVDMYRSNHTVQEIGWHDDLPQELELLLQCNREGTKGQAARQKVVDNFLASLSVCGPQIFSSDDSVVSLQ